MSIQPKPEEAITRYTLATRKSGRMDVIDQPPKRKRIFATLGRRLGYGLLRLFIRNKPFVGKVKIADLRSLLVIPYGGAIGDLIASTPIWRTVKRQNPNCRIGVFTSVRNLTLLQSDPDVDAQYRFESRRDFANRSELRRARKDKYEMVLNLHFTNQTDYGFIAHYVGPNAIKITADHPRRDLYQLFFNHIGIRQRYTVHLSFLSLELLAEVVEFDPPLQCKDAYPTITISEDAENRVAERLREILPPICSGYVLVHTQAGTPFREWGVENSFQLAQKLVDRYSDRAVLLTASPLMFRGLKETVAARPHERIIAFETSPNLLELAALIRRADLVITPETSITHFATATGTPAVVLMSNRSRIPMEWLPLGIPARILAPAIAGEPVATIPVEEVLSAAVSLVSEICKETQTTLDPLAPQNAMFQSSSGLKLLTTFSGGHDE